MIKSIHQVASSVKNSNKTESTVVKNLDGKRKQSKSNKKEKKLKKMQELIKHLKISIPAFILLKNYFVKTVILLPKKKRR